MRVRRVALWVGLTSAWAIMSMVPAIASASTTPLRDLVPPTFSPSPSATPTPTRSLSQAPSALRSAVRKALGASTSLPQSPGEQAKLTASDRTQYDEFGFASAISGNIAVVGAYGKNSGAGAAYVFVRSGSKWSQQAKLTPSDSATGDQFGYSVAISGTTVVVGAYLKNSVTGAAYVFVRSGSTWSQQAKLTAADAAGGDQFGYSVAVSGNTAVVGALGKNSSTGAAYVFVRSGTTWSQQAKLTASDGAAGDAFGDSVAVSGSTALVGANDKASNAGAAYVFAATKGVWSQQAELTASGGAAGDNFGYSVALSGTTAVVGADGVSSSTGAAYVFARSGSTWPEQAELTPSDGVAGDNFGYSVAVSGSTIAVGAPNHNSGYGAAYTFSGSGAAWSQAAELAAGDGAVNDAFGISVAISGTTAVIGASGQSSFTGSAYVFVLPQQFTASDASAGDGLGFSVSISGTTAVVGAPGQDSGAGAAYVFVQSSGGWSQQAKLTASDGAANDNLGISVSISGTTAVVGASGANASTGAAYVFVRSGKTWSQQAKLTASDGAGNDYFGDSVAISGSTAVIGAYGKNSNEGVAYAFVRSAGVWSQQSELTASDGAASDYFGYSVAISGTTAVVGAYGKNSIKGAAYTFAHSSSGWHQQAELTASDGAANDQFGNSVAISGTTAVIGAPGQASGTGAGYVFVHSGSGWQQQAELNSFSAPGWNEAYSVAISGNVLVLGVPGVPGGGGAPTGVAFVFGRSGGSWFPYAELTGWDQPSPTAYFGFSVAVSGTTALAGAPDLSGSSPGAAYVFPYL